MTRNQYKKTIDMQINQGFAVQFHSGYGKITYKGRLLLKTQDVRKFKSELYGYSYLDSPEDDRYEMNLFDSEQDEYDEFYADRLRDANLGW